jgi:hypothetical protein
VDRRTAIRGIDSAEPIRQGRIKARLAGEPSRTAVI